MKKALAIILVATLLGFIASPVWSAGTLKVTAPNGGQKWTTGKTYTIKWSKGNAGATVKIQLLKSSKAYKTIKAKTKNDGRHRWKVPASIKTGSAYTIKITSTKNKKVFDSSNKSFTITKKSGTSSGSTCPKSTSQVTYKCHSVTGRTKAQLANSLDAKGPSGYWSYAKWSVSTDIGIRVLPGHVRLFG